MASRKNCARDDEPRSAGGGSPSTPPPGEDLAGERVPLPPLDTIHPEHVAYVRALVAKFSVTPVHQREDLTQEILIQAYRSRHSPLESRALLFGITRHVVYRWISGHQQELAALAAQQQRPHDDETHPSAEDEWQAAERREAVRASIDDLPEMFRDVFVRVEVDEMSMPEAARDLGIPINTGYSRLHLARTRFAELVHRFLARRRLRKGDLAPLVPPLVLGAPPDVASPGVASPSVASPSVASPGAAAAPVAAPSWASSVMSSWGIAAGTVLVGGAVAAAFVVLSRDPSPPAVIAEQPPTVAVSSRTATLPSSSSAPSTPTAPVDFPGPPRAPLPAPPDDDTEPTDPSPSVAPLPLPTPAPSVRSEGAWARDIARLALAGDRSGASAELTAFRGAYPNSTYLTRLEAMVLHSPSPSSAPSTTAVATPPP